MGTIQESIYFLSAFSIIALASNQVGEFFSRLKLPKITGYLLTGIVAGHFVLDFLSEELVQSLLFIDEFSLTFFAFFTLTRASLELDLLTRIWPIALILFGVRVLSVMIGSFAGGVIACDSMKHNRYKWMGFVTQAGVALGLAKETAVEFPELGNCFATLIITAVGQRKDLERLAL